MCNSWFLLIFGSVYLLGFIAAFVLFAWKDATFEKGAELIRFMVQLPLPLVTFALGYCFGEENRPRPRRR